ncbi:MAG: GntR family transcriptional regulator [Verrucomicrobia bacterium]|nr:GntR family transcriptional regulator [Verrucomicrobiota bacterium]
MFSDFKIQKTSGSRQQIADFVRRMIGCGRLSPGVKLPPTQKLAQRWQTHTATVHAALTPLVREGLLMRCPRRGTFVRKRAERLTRIGIYYSENIWAKESASFQRVVYESLKERLRRLGISLRVWVDPRSRKKQGAPWDELLKAAQNREIQALIVPTTDGPHLAWQNKLPVPSAHATSASIPNRVLFDLPQFVELSLRRLAAQGCRSVGLIGTLSPRHSAPERDGHPHSEFFERFVDLSRELGLRLKNEWIRVLRDEDDLRSLLPERFGYQQFHALWRQRHRPEGLVVFPDLVSRGVVIALLENQVVVPRELTVVLHKDLEVDMLCPLPMHYVTSSGRQMAGALLRLIQQQSRGESATPVTLPFSIATSESAP